MSREKLSAPQRNTPQVNGSQNRFNGVKIPQGKDYPREIRFAPHYRVPVKQLKGGFDWINISQGRDYADPPASPELAMADRLTQIRDQDQPSPRLRPAG